MKSVVLESLIPVNTKMGGPITTLFMPMSAEGSSTSLSDYAKVLKYLSDHLSEWPLFFNPASHSFLQKWLIYALSGSRQIVYKKQCSIRDAEGPARPVDVRLGPTEAERRGNVQWTFDRFKSCRIDFFMPGNC